jgi:hypothetical protein
VVAGLVCLLLLGLGAMGLAWQARSRAQAQLDLSQQNRVILDRVQELLELVQSCTTPTGDCAKQGQAGQAAAIEQIVEQFRKVDGAYSLIVDQCAHDDPSHVVACFHARAKAAGLEK